MYIDTYLQLFLNFGNYEKTLSDQNEPNNSKGDLTHKIIKANRDVHGSTY